MPNSEPWVFLNDGYVPASMASLRIYDLGVVLGATVSEMTRTYRHEPFRLGDHVERLFRSANKARLRPPMGPEEMAKVSRELVAHNVGLLEPDEDLALVHFLTPGESEMYAGGEGRLEASGLRLERGEELPSSSGLKPQASSLKPLPTLVMHTFPLRFERWRHFFIEGVRLVVPGVRHVPPECVDPQIKCRSRMHWWLAMREAAEVDPKAVPLCLDLAGHVTETPGANLLIVRGGQIVSPRGRFILPGISRQTVRELCIQLGIGFHEADLAPDDVAGAEEAFLTGTPYGIAPVTRLDDRPIGGGTVDGPVFRKLAGAWSQRVGLDIVAQVLGRT